MKTMVFVFCIACVFVVRVRESVAGTAWAADLLHATTLNDDSGAVIASLTTADDNKVSGDKNPYVAPKETTSNTNTRSIISVNTDSPLDNNWDFARGVIDATVRPALDFLPLSLLGNYPIENLEIKFNILNMQF